MTPATPRGSLRGEDDAGRLDGDVGAGADGDADVGAGERGGVVDAVADHRDRAARGLAARRPARSLSSGSTSAKTSSTPRSAADGVGDLAGVAGDHHDRATPSAWSSSTACAGLGADLVLERERADDRRSSSDEVAARRRRAPFHCVDRGGERRRARRGRVRAAGPGRRRRTRSPSMVACDAAAGERPELGAPRRSRRARGRRRRWPGPAGARCRPRRRRRAAAPRRRSTPSTPATPVTTWRALGQGAGLVEQHGVDGAHPLEGEAVLDQDAGLAPRPPSTAR